MRFDELGLNDKILEAISYMGYEKASEIQELTVPAILEGKDILACAQTGTGKTAAFMLPILNHISIEDNHDLSTLIIVPTRELAIQINQQIQGFSVFFEYQFNNGLWWARWLGLGCRKQSSYERN